MNTYIIEEFQDLKRKIYLVILPFVIGASLFGFIMELQSDQLDPINRINLPLMFSWFMYVFVSILVKKKIYKHMEVVTFVIISLIHLIKFTFVVHYELGQNYQYNLGEYAYWVPLIYLFISFTFRGKQALLISFVIYGSSLVIGVSKLLLDHITNGQVIDTLIQFYLSSLVLFLFLFFLHRLIEVYIHAQSVQELANTDYLTNLPNRRAMDQRLNQQLHDVDEFDNDFSVILIDIDHFKDINDQYGHDIGDNVLKEFSDVVSQNITNYDYLGRWGGEEFIIICSNQTPKQAQSLSEKLRESISTYSFDSIGNVTASFGISGYQPNDLRQTILKRADDALYQSKANGRNCVTVYSDLEPSK
ncbi:GGDEF domain-containing protein [Bacillus sp. BGMRC 2118]|nr:GGDEF domain-containing protein [Bacillus sp. BGMRC 2118]